MNRLTCQYRRVASTDERETFAERYLSIQPSLDNSRWRGSFELPAVEGSIVDQAINAKTDDLRRLPGGDFYTRSQLSADALAIIAHDSLEVTGQTSNTGTTPNAIFFVDLRKADNTGGKLGSELRYGPRGGPLVLGEVLCGGAVRIVGLEDGQPVVTSQATSSIPPAIRDYVADETRTAPSPAAPADTGSNLTTSPSTSLASPSTATIHANAGGSSHPPTDPTHRGDRRRFPTFRTVPTPPVPTPRARRRSHTTRLSSRCIDGRRSHTYEPAADQHRCGSFYRARAYCCSKLVAIDAGASEVRNLRNETNLSPSTRKPGRLMTTRVKIMVGNGRIGST